LNKITYLCLLKLSFLFFLVKEKSSLHIHSLSLTHTHLYSQTQNTYLSFSRCIVVCVFSSQTQTEIQSNLIDLWTMWNFYRRQRIVYAWANFCSKIFYKRNLAIVHLSQVLLVLANLQRNSKGLFFFRRFIWIDRDELMMVDKVAVGLLLFRCPGVLSCSLSTPMPLFCLLTFLNMKAFWHWKKCWLKYA